jgi:ribosomal protein S27E
VRGGEATSDRRSAISDQGGERELRPAFIDARCRACGAAIGWFGTMADMPVCRTCGAEPDRDGLAAVERRLAEARERALADDDSDGRDATAGGG